MLEARPVIELAFQIERSGRGVVLHSNTPLEERVRFGLTTRSDVHHGIWFEMWKPVISQQLSAAHGPRLGSSDPSDINTYCM